MRETGVIKREVLLQNKINQIYFVIYFAHLYPNFTFQTESIYIFVLCKGMRGFEDDHQTLIVHRFTSDLFLICIHFPITFFPINMVISHNNLGPSLITWSFFSLSIDIFITLPFCFSLFLTRFFSRVHLFIQSKFYFTYLSHLKYVNVNFYIAFIPVIVAQMCFFSFFPSYMFYL